MTRKNDPVEENAVYKNASIITQILKNIGDIIPTKITELDSRC